MLVNSIDGGSVNLVKEEEGIIEPESVLYFYRYKGDLYYNLITDMVLANRNLLFLISWAGMNLDDVMTLLEYSSRAKDNNKCKYTYEVVDIEQITDTFIKIPTN